MTKTFPNELDNAKVLYYAEPEIPETLYCADGTVWCEICFYAICKYEKDDNYYLFKCDSNLEVQSDYLCESIDECKNAVKNLKLKWISK